MSIVKLAKLQNIFIFFLIIIFLTLFIILGDIVLSGKDKISSSRGLFSVGYNTALGLFLTLAFGFLVIAIALIRRYLYQRRNGHLE